MSPLLSQPNRGYADWQRIVNWDNGVIYHDPLTTYNAQVFAGPFDVSRSGYVSILDTITAGQCIVTAQWYTDALGTIFLGQRQWVISSLVSGPMQMRMPNLGPYIGIFYQPIGGANFTRSSAWVATNRVHPLEAIPQQSMLLQVTTGVIAPNNNTILVPNFYYAGPVRLLIDSLNALNWTVALEMRSLTGGSVVLDSEQGAGIVGITTVAPLGFWFLLLTNNAAANDQYNVAVTASDTGSI